MNDRCRKQNQDFTAMARLGRAQPCLLGQHFRRLVLHSHDRNKGTLTRRVEMGFLERSRFDSPRSSRLRRGRRVRGTDHPIGARFSPFGQRAWLAGRVGGIAALAGRSLACGGVLPYGCRMATTTDLAPALRGQLQRIVRRARPLAEAAADGDTAAAFDLWHGLLLARFRAARGLPPAAPLAAPPGASRLEALLASLDPATFMADDALGWTWQFWRAAEMQANGA